MPAQPEPPSKVRGRAYPQAPALVTLEELGVHSALCLLLHVCGGLCCPWGEAPTPRLEDELGAALAWRACHSQSHAFTAGKFAKDCQDWVLVFGLMVSRLQTPVSCISLRGDVDFLELKRSNAVLSC